MLVIGAVIGWRWYNDYTQTREEAASATYQRYLEARQRDAKPEEARNDPRDARQRFPQHRLSDLLDVLPRTRRGEAQDYAKATQYLETVVKDAKDDHLRDVARLRVARLAGAGRQYRRGARNAAQGHRHRAFARTSRS